MNVYTKIFVGLATHYARDERYRRSARLQAAAIMSLMFSVALTAAIVITDYLVYGTFERSVQFFGHKFVILGIGAVIGYAHVQWGMPGRDDNVELNEPPRWRSLLAVYVLSVLVLVLGAAACVILERRA